MFGTPFTAQVSNKDGADVSNLFGAPFTAQVSNKDACMMAAHTFVWYTLHCTGVKQGRCRCKHALPCKTRQAVPPREGVWIGWRSAQPHTTLC